MSEDAVGLVVGQVFGALDEVATYLLNMPSSSSQVHYGTVAVVVGVAVAAAVTGGIYLLSDGLVEDEDIIRVWIGSETTWQDGRHEAGHYIFKKSPWVRKRRHYPLTKQQWLESFEPREGRLVAPEKVISIARRGGIHITIRADVWPFLLGLYDIKSSEAERKVADFVHKEEFDELRRQCDVLRERVTTELKRRTLERDDSGSFEKVNEAEVLESMLEENGVTDGTASGPETVNTNDTEIQTTSESETVQDDEPSKNPMVDHFLKSGHKAMEDFRDWCRIIRLDAVRMNAEWVPYSAVQANVSEEEADRRANEVGIQDHGHLEASRTHHAARLVAILEAYALYDPETGYCQGMSDLLSPFVALMESDSEAFWCFVLFMNKAKANFRTDETGIRRQLQLVAKIFEVSDPQFYDHLLRIQAEDCFFVYRMVVVLLRRELNFEQTVCLWEVIWADWAALRMKGSKRTSEGLHSKGRLPASEDFLLFTIAAAILQQRRFIIERCRGVDEILRECNGMAGKLDIWELMDFGREILRDYQQKVGHEKTE